MINFSLLIKNLDEDIPVNFKMHHVTVNDRMIVLLTGITNDLNGRIIVFENHIIPQLAELLLLNKKGD